MEIDYSYEKKLTSVVYDFEFEVGEVFSVFVYTKKEWQKRKATPFYKNVLENHLVL